jgi:hypothetical protein
MKTFAHQSIRYKLLALLLLIRIKTMDLKPVSDMQTSTVGAERACLS